MDLNELFQIPDRQSLLASVDGQIQLLSSTGCGPWQFSPIRLDWTCTGIIVEPLGLYDYIMFSNKYFIIVIVYRSLFCLSEIVFAVVVLCGNFVVAFCWVFGCVCCYCCTVICVVLCFVCLIYQLSSHLWLFLIITMVIFIFPQLIKHSLINLWLSWFCYIYFIYIILFLYSFCVFSFYSNICLNARSPHHCQTSSHG